MKTSTVFINDNGQFVRCTGPTYSTPEVCDCMVEQPTPGARLKYPELGATAQHSVTLPESCWQDIEALGVNPKGKNVRSEGVFRLWQAWKEATVSR